MSYIRSGSNPEKLYIWDDGDNVSVSVGCAPNLEIPSDVWLDFLKGWVDFDEKWGGDAFSYKGVQVDMSGVGGRNVILSYHKWDAFVEMCYVTWYYLIHSNSYRWENE